MKYFKKFMLVFVVLAMVVSLVACGGNDTTTTQGAKEETTEATPDESQDESKDQLIVGVSMQGNQSGFIQYITSGIWEHESQNSDEVKVEVMFADDDASQQLSQIETFISKKVDAIIINPVDRVQGATAVDLAKEAGIPIITVNTMTDSENNTAHVGSDDVQSGIMQMERAIEVIGDNGKVAYIDAVLGHSAQVGRSQGYAEVLGRYPNVELVVNDTGNWSGDESMQLVENWIQAGLEMNAILCMADVQLIGVITAVESAGKLGEIKLMGMDCDPVVMDAIKAGTVDSSIWQDGVKQGEEALRVAIAAAKGEEVEDLFIPYEICHGDNIEEYLEKAEGRNALARKYF